MGKNTCIWREREREREKDTHTRKKSRPPYTFPSRLSPLALEEYNNALSTETQKQCPPKESPILKYRPHKRSHEYDDRPIRLCSQKKKKILRKKEDWREKKNRKREAFSYIRESKKVSPQNALCTTERRPKSSSSSSWQTQNHRWLNSPRYETTTTTSFFLSSFCLRFRGQRGAETT